jgi:integrase
MALNIRTVESLKPGKERRTVPDGLVTGLYLQIEPTGSKSWSVRYRHSGRTRKYTFGKYPGISLKSAREQAAKALQAVAEGRDPAHEKKLQRSTGTDTFAAVAALFLERYGKGYRKRTREIVTGMLRVHVLPRWGSRLTGDITRRDVIALLDEIVDGGSLISANRTFAVVRKIFNWSVTRDLIVSSPCVGVRAPTPERPRDRVLDDPELRLVWEAADELGGPYGALIKLLILTGQRLSEVAKIRWIELDIEARLWSIPSERCKNGRAHSVFLSTPAVELLRGLPRIAGSEFVLTTNGRVPAAGFGKHKRRLDALLPPDMPHWVVHDIRRSVATGLARIGVALPVIEKILNHQSGSFGGIVGVYQRHDFADERRTALDAWAAHVERIVSGATNVVALREARR